MKKVKTMKKINKLSSDESHHVMKVIMWWKSSCDESHQLMKVIKWWKLSSGESYQVMKVIKWWKLSSNESFLVMKLIWWWKLFSHESYLVMKVILWLKLKGWGAGGSGILQICKFGSSRVPKDIVENEDLLGIIHILTNLLDFFFQWRLKLSQIR